jgi:hydroxymethylglutaryl-CoA lyase
MLKIIDCPRDAMQGIHDFIPTDTKIAYLNTLLKVGFDTLDFGSFVSPKAIPQMRDTAEVLEKLDLSSTKTQLLAIVANQKGAEQASVFPEIAYLGYPFSVSDIFQQRNTNRTLIDSFPLVEEMLQICQKTNKNLVVYLSMAFGNPYNEAYSPEIVEQCAEKLVKLGVNILALSDTIGVSTPENISDLYGHLAKKFPLTEIGVHLHSLPDRNTVFEKINAAYQAGCRRFDGAMRGFGGCPMAKDDLVGNMDTALLVEFFAQKGMISPDFSTTAFQNAWNMAGEVFLGE